MSVFFKKLATRGDFEWFPYRKFLQEIGERCNFCCSACRHTCAFRGFATFVLHHGKSQGLRDVDIHSLILFFRDEAAFYNPSLLVLSPEEAVDSESQNACPPEAVPFFAGCLALCHWVDLATHFRKRGWRINVEGLLSAFWVPLIMKYCAVNLLNPVVFYESWTWSPEFIKTAQFGKNEFLFHTDYDRFSNVPFDRETLLELTPPEGGYVDVHRLIGPQFHLQPARLQTPTWNQCSLPRLQHVEFMKDEEESFDARWIVHRNSVDFYNMNKMLCASESYYNPDPEPYLGVTMLRDMYTTLLLDEEPMEAVEIRDAVEELRTLDLEELMNSIVTA